MIPSFWIYFSLLLETVENTHFTIDIPFLILIINIMKRSSSFKGGHRGGSAPPISNHKQLMKCKHLPIKRIIISGSPIKLSEHIETRDFILNCMAIIGWKVPILGICFGCQFLHTMNGGKLEDLGDYVCTDIKVSLDTAHDLFRNCQKTDYPRFCFSDLIIPSSSVKPIAWMNFDDKLKMPCAFDFGNDIYGTMFHPEYTPEILKNFLID